MIDFSPIRHDAIEALTLLEAAATPYSWTAKNLTDSFEASADCRLIEYQGESMGYCVVRTVLDEAELLNMVIFRPFQSQGYGAEVIQKLKLELTESGVKTLFLEVRVSNVIAQALYEKMGFEVLSTRRNYYHIRGRETEDAIVMRCCLKKEPGFSSGK